MSNFKKVGQNQGGFIQGNKKKKTAVHTHKCLTEILGQLERHMEEI